MCLLLLVFWQSCQRFSRMLRSLQSFATFDDPFPACNTPSTIVVCSGVGTNRIQWGNGSDPSYIQFQGASFFLSEPFFGTNVESGRFLYHNGTQSPGTQISGIQFSTAFDFIENSLTGRVGFSTDIFIVNTPNTGDPIADADYLVLATLIRPAVLLLKKVTLLAS